MGPAVPVTIPRWQWRTVAPDLSSLFRRLPVPPNGPERRETEIHLICHNSSHSAVVRGGALELRWRKETGPDGFELWDTILHVELPFRAADLQRLWAAWELPHPSLQDEYRTIDGFLQGPIAAAAGVTPVTLSRSYRSGVLQGVSCSMETLDVVSAMRLQSFCVEHEDPSLLTQLLAGIGLRGCDNINLLHGLRTALGLEAATTRRGRDAWRRK